MMATTKEKPRKGSLKSIKDTCTVCHNTVTNKQKGVKCDICEFWFHASCQDVTDSLYDCLNRDDNTIHWYCKGCTGSVSKMYSMVCAIHSRQDVVEKKVDNVSDSVESCKKHITEQSVFIENMSHDLRDMKNSLPRMISTQVSTALTERVEREKRESNLIFFRVPESKAELEATKVEDDRKFVKDLCRSLGVEGVNIISSVRHRKSGTTADARPLQVTLGDKGVRQAILSNARHLKTVDEGKYSDIAISRDQTKSQREDYKRLLDVLKLKRASDPSTKWIIRGDQVVSAGKMDPPAGGSFPGV